MVALVTPVSRQQVVAAVKGLQGIAAAVVGCSLALTAWLLLPSARVLERSISGVTITLPLLSCLMMQHSSSYCV